MMRPRPNPAKVHPTNAKGDCCKKKNPTPMPMSMPPPVAHVLLSSLLCAFSILLTSVFCADDRFHLFTLTHFGYFTSFEQKPKHEQQLSPTKNRTDCDIDAGKKKLAKIIYHIACTGNHHQDAEDSGNVA